LVTVIYEKVMQAMNPAEPTPSDSPATLDAGLPPVQPPSGRFIVQLFVVPGLIVGVVLLVLMGLVYYWNSALSPEYFLRQLDSSNDDIRWRAASDLAQILKRPESGSQKWKADPVFALELAQRLRRSLDELARAERETAERVAKLTTAEQDTAWRKLATQRHHVSFLASALGDFHIPVGIPLLAEICLNDTSPDLKGNTMQRRKALWSLFNLGANTRAFSKLAADKRLEALDTLRSEAAGAPPRAGWARTALFYLDPARPNPADVVHVDEVLARCARAQDRYLREQVAVTFSFWDGPAAESTLLILAQDDGHGTLLGITEID
jgi:hypothetical protein